ncbi:MAG TPA: bifunctional DNA-formamidopyrimidine glycosylase/DNA-(apurinic or apyrimidinic site) lyase [Actinomycetes bacterium]|nr:bifunctional DNA-formamidopyrimidine glycosylase/DNA-(apurinic or apyrimidinic site) lyase [Actinomycetes bacterium]
MPELPEVEVVRRGLARWVAGRVVADVEVRHPRAVRRHVPGATDFAARLSGRRLGQAHRRGKYLWLTLDDDPETTAGRGEALVAHLGMSGQLLVEADDAPDETHLRVRLRFADRGPQLRFVDQRTFGGLALDATVDGVPASVAHIARDPLDPDFDDAGFVAALRSRRTGLKRALLDQTLVSGVGNIYADESLWRARLHGARATATLRPVDARRVLAAVRAVLTEALAAGGTSFDALYVDVNGTSGWFERSLAVYGRAGQPCPRCATPVRREPFMNRSSYSCPRCQPRPRHPVA